MSKCNRWFEVLTLSGKDFFLKKNCIFLIAFSLSSREPCQEPAQELPQPLVQWDLWGLASLWVYSGGQEGSRDGYVLPLDMEARAAAMLGHLQSLALLPAATLLGDFSAPGFS